MYLMSLFLSYAKNSSQLIPAAERYKARVRGRSLVGIADSNAAGVMNVCPFLSVCVVR
jgi:hypothetical protein